MQLPQRDTDLGTAHLASLIEVSQRHLTRLFTEHTGRTPARFGLTPSRFRAVHTPRPSAVSER
ncbi:hypothetical protein ACQPYE_10455 [Actinosynnema sp. CA-299493]